MEADVKLKPEDENAKVDSYIDDSDPNGAIFAVIKLGAYEVKERIGRHVLNWDDEKQLWYLDGVNKRLMRRLKKMLYVNVRMNSTVEAERKERLEAAKASQQRIKERRVERMAKRREKKKTDFRFKAA